MATELGKRYRCKKCGTEALCVKAGEGTPNCDGEDMELLQPRPVPSSD